MGDDGDGGGQDDAHGPDDDRGLLPELEREELDEAFGGWVERVGAAREEDLVEDLEQRVERDERNDAADGEGRDEDDGSTAHRIPGPCPRGTATTRRHDQGGQGEDQRDREEPDEHGAHVAHVPALALVEHRRTGHGDIEVGRAEDQVGEDRVGRRPELGLREPGPGQRLGASLLERDPHRVQE